DDADTASDRDATLGAAADAPLADVGALVEGHVTTLVRRRACGEGSAALATQDAAHAFPHRRGRGLVVDARRLLAREPLDLGHHGIRRLATRAARGGGAEVREVERLAELHRDPGETDGPLAA